MHILYFHQHFSTPQGAAGTRSYEMAQALVRAGHSVTMVCGSYAQGETGLEEPFNRGRRRGAVDGIDVIEFNLGYSNHMGPIRRIGVFVRFGLASIATALREPCDLVFATSTPLTAGIPGVFARWFRRKPFVFEVRDLWPELPRAMGVITNPMLIHLMSALEWISYRSAHRLVGLSPGIVNGIVSRGVPASKVLMVPNGCDLAIFRQDSMPWRPEGVRENQLLAIFTGTHGLANGLHAALDAALVLKRWGRDDIRILLIGEGREKSALQARAQEESLDNIIFLDPVPKRRLAGLLAGADIGLQLLKNVPAFYYGTSPNKFFDYISAKLPVINNYPGWVADLIEAHGAGFVVPPEDPEAFASALVYAAEHSQDLKAMGQNAGALADTRFARGALSSEWVAWVTSGAKTVS